MKLKLPNGYGSIVKLSGARRRPFMVRITTELTPDGKQIRKVLGYFAKEKDALIFLADYNKNPYDPENAGITFAKLYDKWSDEKYKGEKTPNNYAAAYAWCKSLHDENFQTLKTADFQTVIDNCEAGYSSKKNIKILINQMTKYALANDIVQKNYVELCKLPLQEESRMHRPFSAAELQKLWNLAPKNKNVQIVLILCYTGLRPTELCKIESSNVNLAEHYMLGGIKTAAGKNRVIPIADKILPFIEKLYSEGHFWLLEDEDGQLNYDKLRPRYWETAMTLLPMEMREHLPHDGRHTCATMMDNAGINDKIKKLILGHAGKDVTEKVYTHKTIEQLVEAINKI